MEIINVGGRKKVNPSQVILLVSDINYTNIYLCSGEKILVATTLKKLEKRFLPFHSFIRTSKSHLVNFFYALEYEQNTVNLMNELKADISRRRRRFLPKII